MKSISTKLSIISYKQVAFVKQECPRQQQSPKWYFFFHKSHGQSQKVIDLGVIWKGFNS